MEGTRRDNKFLKTVSNSTNSVIGTRLIKMSHHISSVLDTCRGH